MIELLLIVVIVGIIASLAIPNLLAARRAANEASAISTIRNYHSAQLAFQATGGDGNYAGDVTGTINAFAVLANANLIDTELSSGFKSGYFFQGLAIPRGASNPASFIGAGIPSTFGSAAPLSVIGEMRHTGNRVFVISADGVMRWESITGMADPSELTMQVDVVDNAFVVTGGSLLGN
ncbi:MAG: type II secretion system protein [Acidobacteria bacterium]|nr:type II secretion system protein [Acidobacteriota bacterium]MBK8146851.1 type II secretion system protein [Acidobacteriota bacterium]MBK8813093.1 type II secretion system protein [Acidobacteriota bacterium]